MSDHPNPCRGCDSANLQLDPGNEEDPPRLWMEPGDLAELTFDTGETIAAMWTRPRGTHAGWVLADGGRIRARIRSLVHIRIVYPPEHTAEEIVIHHEPADTPDPSPEHDQRRAGQGSR